MMPPRIAYTLSNACSCTFSGIAGGGGSEKHWPVTFGVRARRYRFGLPSAQETPVRRMNARRRRFGFAAALRYEASAARSPRLLHGCQGIALNTANGHRPASADAEANNMHRFRFLAGLFLGIAMIAPIVATAEDHPYNKKYYDNRRYYDHASRDYHTWNAGEDRAYNSYLTDQHLPYREWRTVKGPDQQAYFTWRHTHPDSAIVTVK
jgi:hypothetical protein